MSRGAAVKFVLGEKSASVVCVKPTGDCFYECVQQAFFSAGLDVRQFPGVNCEEGDDGMQALRRTAAEAVDKNIFDQFSMYHTAGPSSLHCNNLFLRTPRNQTKKSSDLHFFQLNELDPILGLDLSSRQERAGPYRLLRLAHEC